MSSALIIISAAVVAVVLVAITHWVYRWKNPSCAGVLPPGSMGFPIIGESLDFFSPQSLEAFPPFISKRVARYGNLFRTSLVGQPIIVCTDPEINHTVFKQEGKLFQCYYTESAVKITGQEGLIVQHGIMHKYLRNFILGLIGPESLKETLLHEIDENTLKHMQLWTQQQHNDVDIKEASETMVFALIAKKMLCLDEEEALKLREDYKSFTDGFISFPLNIPGTSYYAALKGRKNVVKIIKSRFKERRLTNQSQHEFLDQILEEIENEETPLTEGTAVDLVFLLLFAAYETTSQAIALALKFLNGQPQVLKQLEEEHEAILRNRKGKESAITWKEYKSMTFTHMVINETVRLANIVPGIFRKVMEDVQIKGYTIPAGWTFMACPTSIHLDSSKYEDPFKFNPSRWIGQELHNGSKKFMAFGGGSRLCVGADFAKLQMAIFLHHLVTKYRWEVTKEGKIIRQPGLMFGNGIRVQFWEK